MNKIKSFQDLEAWQVAHGIALKIYQITELFPSSEKYNLCDQMRRAALSVSSNIAEGFYRFGSNDKIRFYNTAVASLGELEAQLCLAEDLALTNKETVIEIEAQLLASRKLTLGLIRYMKEH